MDDEFAPHQAQNWFERTAYKVDVGTYQSMPQ